MSLNILLAFWSVSILFVITPGVDWAYAISAGIKGNKVLPAVSGLLTGHLIATLFVAAGVGTLITSQPAFLLILTIVGSLYLLWIGFNLFLHPAEISTTNISTPHLDSFKTWYIKGICVSGLNPKVFLLFLALLPPFIDQNGSISATYQIILLGLIHIISCGVVYFVVGYSAKKVLSSRPRAAKVVSKLSGALMIMIALFLLWERL
ncbi:LysE family translocator [Acinetobacter pittii]|uniref:LysE family translocator n=1 Tax=Acinetobacter pittii TaxID=48296 RepID=UPI001EE5CE83|nr:LysE family translocator [Acinetobacter pittii]MCG5226806.1 LysE family translocator [Acinetobacter pittii]